MTSKPEGFDWKHFNESFSWQRLGEEAFVVTGGDDHENCFGMLGACHSIVPLNLALTEEDVAALKAGYGHFASSDQWDYVFKFDGEMLFAVHAVHDSCDWIIRVEACAGGYRAVDGICLGQDADRAALETRFMAEMLGSLLPGCRFGISEEDGETWFWRGPEDAGYLPDPNPWYRMQPWQRRLVDLSRGQRIPLRLSDDEGRDLGPPRWSATDFDLLKSDPRLCCDEGINLLFDFDGDGLLCFSDPASGWCRVVFESADGEVISPSALVGLPESGRLFLDRFFSENDRLDEDLGWMVCDVVSDLLEAKRGYRQQAGSLSPSPSTAQ